MKIFWIVILGLLFNLSFYGTTLASTTDGTIDSVNRYTWSETSGWIDFGVTTGNVHVTDTVLSGYAFGENIGWINLNTVINDGNGVLSGKAWSETSGWIDFKPDNGGVNISSSGVFSGYAFGENIGWINFNVANPITTDWRPTSARQASTPSSQVVSNGSPVGNYGQINSNPSSIINFIVPTNNPTTTPSINSTSSSQNFISHQSVGLIKENSTSTKYNFTRNRSLWSVNKDVKELQIFLNNHGYYVSVYGPGSAGKETTLFGKATYKALVKFQKENGIKPASGYFGTLTREIINNSN